MQKGWVRKLFAQGDYGMSSAVKQKSALGYWKLTQICIYLIKFFPVSHIHKKNIWKFLQSYLN